MKYLAIIVDDEPKLSEVLLIKLRKHCPEIFVADQVENIDAAYKSIIKNNPDIVFLDISMPNGSGFDLIRKFENISFQIIFVTGFDEFALDALKISAVDYLLKPVKTSDVVEAVRKSILNIEAKNKMHQLELDILKHNVDNIGSQDIRITIPGSESYEFIVVKNIIRCEGWQKYTRIYLTTGEIILSSYNIGVFADYLIKCNFYSCHKSHLINLNLIERYLKTGEIIMCDGAIVPVSRRRKEDFKNHYITDLKSNASKN